MRIAQQFLGGFAQCRVPPFRRDLSQRDQNKRPFLHPGMRDFQVWPMKDLIVICEQVKIDFARPPFFPRGRPAHRLLNAEQGAQKIGRRQRGIEQGRAVEEFSLRRAADRVRFVPAGVAEEPGLRQFPEMPDCLLQLCLPVAQIRP